MRERVSSWSVPLQSSRCGGLRSLAQILAQIVAFAVTALDPRYGFDFLIGGIQTMWSWIWPILLISFFVGFLARSFAGTVGFHFVLVEVLELLAFVSIAVAYRGPGVFTREPFLVHSLVNLLRVGVWYYPLAFGLGLLSVRKTKTAQA